MKKHVLCFLSFMICMFLCTNSFALTKLYETNEKEVVSSGANLTKYKRFTDKGWLSINILDVDLTDKHTDVTVLTSESGLQTFQNVKNMLTNEKNCIAAINADFFNGTSKKGNIIGMTIKDGELLTSTYYENEVKDTLASFVLDEDNNALFDYFTNKIVLENSKNDKSIMVSEINKWSSNYEYPVLYTSDWGEYSLGSTEELVLTELVVKNNKVVEVRHNKEAVKIPENGFVISALGNVADVMQKYFKKGNKVKLNIDLELDVDKVKMAVSGGTILVKDGEIAKFTHNITGSNPRTAIGLSKDGKTLYLITVDGRQASSIGLTQTELAELLVEKGIYTAMNLDGGGSTTMVVRPLGEHEAVVQNKPSDGGLRNVPNAIAVFNTEKTGSLENLLIEVDDVNVFVGCEKELKVKGYDKYYNPVSIESSKIKWSYEGVDVKFKGNTLIAGEIAGTSKITASIGKAKASINIDVLSKPNELTISPKKVRIGNGESVTFSVSGQNKNGYFANLLNDEVEWEIEEGMGYLKDGVFTARAAGEVIISVSAGNAKSYALIMVDASRNKLLKDFETSDFTFKSYPEEVTGEAVTSNDEVFDGKSAAKLSYDFTKTTKTRAAYLRFNENVILDKNAEKLGVMAYATASTSDQIKVKLLDSNGETKYLLFCKGLESNGWQELELDLKSVSLPAKLIDIYIAQDNPNELTSGTVYFDNLSVSYKADNEIIEGELPIDIKGVDELNVYSDLENENSFRIVISPDFYEGIMLEKLKNQKMTEIINKSSEIVIFPSQNDGDLLGNIESTKKVSSSYGVINHKAATIISLDISNGGLRKTNSNQWIDLQNDIKKANKNVLVVLNGNLEEFEDTNEKELFIDVLCDLRRVTGKNIWVIQDGDNTDYSMKRGVKYLSISSEKFENPTLEDIMEAKYILITVNENKMTYEIKSVF